MSYKIGNYEIKIFCMSGMLYDFVIEDTTIKESDKEIARRNVNFDNYKKDRFNTIKKAIIPSEKDKKKFTPSQLEDMLKPGIDSIGKKLV